MFEACEGCGGLPDHEIDSPKCVERRSEAVRIAQKLRDDAIKRIEEAELTRRRKLSADRYSSDVARELRRLMVD